MMKTLSTGAIPSILEKYSSEEFDYRRVTDDDLNEDYFALLAQLTSVGQVDFAEAKEFYANNLKSNPVFFLFAICVFCGDSSPKPRQIQA